MSPHLKTRQPNLPYAELMPFWNAIGTLTFGLPLFLLMLILSVVFLISSRAFVFTKIINIVQYSLNQTQSTISGSRIQVSGFQAGMLSLCGTVGAAGLLGVISAVRLGGAGAILWMWVFGLLILVFKHFETTLAVHWRRVYNDGSVFGGPMLYIARGLVDSNARVVGIIGGMFAVLSLLVALTYGNIIPVSNATTVLHTALHIPKAISSLILAVALMFVVAGGVARAGRVASLLFPIMVGLLFMLCLFVLIQHLGNIPKAFSSVFSNAFGIRSLTAGALGLGIQKVISEGMARALLSTGAGMGSSSIAHAQAQTVHAARQGLWGFLEGLIGLCVSGFFALVVLCVPSAFNSKNTFVVLFNIFGLDSGNGLLSSLSTVGIAITLGLFAFAALIAWEFYAEESLGYLFGDGIRWSLKIVFCGLVFLAPLYNFSSITSVVPIFIGIMVFINLIGLLLLSPQVNALTAGFFRGEAYQPPDLNNQIAPDLFEEFDFDLK
jgi:alanine or glycine:cation symporter, AGCS family